MDGIVERHSFTTLGVESSPINLCQFHTEVGSHLNGEELVILVARPSEPDLRARKPLLSPPLQGEV